MVNVDRVSTTCASTYPETVSVQFRCSMCPTAKRSVELGKYRKSTQDGPSEFQCRNSDEMKISQITRKLFKSDTGDASCSKSAAGEAKRLGASVSNRRMTSNTPDPSVSKPSDIEHGLKLDGDGRVARGNWSHSSSDCDLPDFIKWSENLDLLLNDAVGLDLFQEYLKQEDQDRYHMLKFWLACRGLHRQPKERLTDCIKVIYSQLFLKIGQGISGDMGKSLAQQILIASKHKTLLSPSVFDEASKVVYKAMKTIMYPNFLSSETYLNYAQKMQTQPCDLDNNSGEAAALADDELPKNCSQSLPIVEEDKELNFDALSITKPESLRQLLKSRPSSCSRMSMNSRHRLHYNSYNPVSRQESELHSLSSGRTDSQSDLTQFAEDSNAVSDTGKSYVEQRVRHKQRQRSKRTEEQQEKIIINKMVNMPEIRPVIPRTFNADVPNKIRGAKPHEFFNQLAPKLEELRKEMDAGGLVRNKMNSIDEGGPSAMAQHSFSDSTLNRMDDDDQDILDEHVKRVWSDKTPGKSPSIGTPTLPKSPVARRAFSVYNCPSEKIYYPSSCSSRSSHVHPGYVSAGRRRERDDHSTFSVDSGNGTDRAECVNFSRRNSSYKHKAASEHSVQSASTILAHPGLYPPYASGSWTGSQKTITDSGVSVLTKSIADSVAGTSSACKDRMVSSWQQERKSSQCGKSSRNLMDDMDLPAAIFKKKTKSVSGQSKSKGGTMLKNASLPAQPFLADPNMPPLPFYKINARDTLDETKRRLQDLPSVQLPPKVSSCHTSVVYSFSDETVPYLLKVPGSKITLKTFKDHMPPKKGNFRYFFVTMCEEFENKPVYEEINDDNRVLPLWKGKIMSQIKDSK